MVHLLQLAGFFIELFNALQNGYINEVVYGTPFVKTRGADTQFKKNNWNYDASLKMFAAYKNWLSLL